MENYTLQFFAFMVVSATLVLALLRHHGRDLRSLVGYLWTAAPRGGLAADGLDRGGPPHGKAVQLRSGQIPNEHKQPPEPVAPAYIAPSVVASTVTAVKAPVISKSAPDAIRVGMGDIPGCAGYSRAEILQIVEGVGAAVRGLRPVLSIIKMKRDCGEAVAVDDVSVSVLEDLETLKIGCGKLGVGAGANADRFALLRDDVAQFRDALLRLIGLARMAPLEGSWTDPVAATLEDLLARVGSAMGGIEAQMRAEASLRR